MPMKACGQMHSVYMVLLVDQNLCWETGVARKDLPEGETFEMMLKVEKELGMPRAGRRTFQMGK